jgi:nucleoside-diphosphate-sugar epimerase
MNPTNVLFIGGTGTISAACVALAAERGAGVSVVNRGLSASRPLPPDVEVLRADVRDADAVATLLEGRSFDAVVDFVAYTPDDVVARLELFRGRTGQYVFISSASAYQTPAARLPVIESTPLKNPYWAYSRAKIAAEEVVIRAYRDDDYPITIVRPSHTYDRCSPPLIGGWTQIERMRRGQEVVVHGDGTSLWTLTHSRDFAPGLLGLLGDPRAIGDTFHITSDDVLTWNQIFGVLANAAGVDVPRLAHIPSDVIAAEDASWGAALLGDAAHSSIFDNSKLRALVPDFLARIPFHVGAREVVEWFDADRSRQQVDAGLNSTIERLLETYSR